jgi:hypothetical protein
MLGCSENRDPVRSGIPGTVLILCVLKNSFSVFQQIRSGTANILGFSKTFTGVVQPSKNQQQEGIGEGEEVV